MRRIVPELTIHGARLHYDEVGEGETVLFLHGALATGLAFRGQRAALQDLGRLVFVDQRGHGKSAHFGRDVGWETLAYDQLVADAHALVDALSPDAPVHLVGVSMGGMVGARVAAQRPERVASLALLSTAGRQDGPWRAFFEVADPDEIRFARLAARWHGEDYWRELAGALFHYFATAARGFPERIDVAPALVMQATHDELLAPDEADHWRARFTTPPRVERPPGDHQFFADGRDGSKAANAALRQHLARAMSRSS